MSAAVAKADVALPPIKGAAPNPDPVSPATSSALKEDAERLKEEKKHVIAQQKKIVEQVNTYNASTQSLNERLASVQAMLAKFAVKQKEAQSKPVWTAKAQAIAERSRTTVQQKAKQRDLRPCWIIKLLPADLLQKVFQKLTGKEIFRATMACRTFRSSQDELELWEEKFERELTGVAFDFDDVTLAKRAFKKSFVDWSFVVGTLKWLEGLEHPTDVSGTKSGVPLRKRVMDTLILTARMSGPGQAEARVEVLRTLGTKTFAALIQNPSHHLQEKAMATLANVLSSEKAGRQVVQRYCIKPLKAMLFSHCIGLQKQAARCLINAWIEEEHRVVSGISSAMMRAPSRDRWRGDRVDWLCVQFSPGGEANPLQHLTMYSDSEGCLKGVGEDEQGPFTLHEADLDRALQWANGPSLAGQEEAAPKRGGRHGGAIIRTGSEGSLLAEALGGGGGGVGAAGEARERPPLQRGMSMGVGSEAVERMRGFQERYSSTTSHNRADAGGKMLYATEGSEHLELFKTHETAHGLDHVKMVAFPDAEGLFGIWEMGRFYFQEKIVGGTRGVFRMYQLDRDRDD